MWVVVDRLDKLTNFISVRIDYDVEQLDKAYVKEIVKLQWVPLSIISDRGTQYASMFLRKSHDELGKQIILVKSPIYRHLGVDFVTSGFTPRRNRFRRTLYGLRLDS